MGIHDPSHAQFTVINQKLKKKNMHIYRGSVSFPKKKETSFYMTSESSIPVPTNVITEAPLNTQRLKSPTSNRTGGKLSSIKKCIVIDAILVRYYFVFDKQT